MKKVRMAIGTMVPTVGMLIIPAAAAHASRTSARAHTTTTGRHGRAAVQPAVTCPGASNTSVEASANGELFGFISYNGSCVDFQQATLTHRQSGLTERVRFRNRANQILKQYRRGGSQIGGSTLFWSEPPNAQHAHEVCQALVANNTSNVRYGAVCEFTA
jgi:hypothetical protein